MCVLQCLLKFGNIKNIHLTAFDIKAHNAVIKGVSRKIVGLLRERYVHKRLLDDSDEKMISLSDKRLIQCSFMAGEVLEIDLILDLFYNFSDRPA